MWLTHTILIYVAPLIPDLCGSPHDSDSMWLTTQFLIRIVHPIPDLWLTHTFLIM
jgi:hypothetical protein